MAADPRLRCLAFLYNSCDIDAKCLYTESNMAQLQDAGLTFSLQPTWYGWQLKLKRISLKQRLPHDGTKEQIFKEYWISNYLKDNSTEVPFENKWKDFWRQSSLVSSSNVISSISAK